MRNLFQFFILLLACLLLLPFSSRSQVYEIKGRVVDAETLSALAFVNIQVNGTHEGTMTDLDGKFSLSVNHAVKYLRISSIGYAALLYEIAGKKNYFEIKLKPEPLELTGISISPGINPADRIINRVIDNKSLNDYEQLPEYRYTAYEKTFFGPETDSIPYFEYLAHDTGYLRSRDFFAKQHLFLMENVSDRSFRFPDQRYNRVIASRVSGLSDPLFVFLLSELQSASFYSDVIKLADIEYVSPLSRAWSGRYYFEIQDTLVELPPYDTTYVIAFRPLTGSRFRALTGTLSVSTNGYAIRSVSAAPATDEGAFTVRIQQLYDYVAGSHWFPVQLNTDLVFVKAKIVLDRQLNTGVPLMGRSRSYISDIDLHPQLRRSRFGIIETEVQPGAYATTEASWNAYRRDSLTGRELNTYRIIDSLGKAENLDMFSRRIDALFNAKLNFGYFDLSLLQVLKHNRFEGLRSAIGLSTSDRLISWLTLNGYIAYGFKDQNFKYGGGIAGVISKTRNMFLKLSYANDLFEAGAGNPFPPGSILINPMRFRESLVEKMDAVESLKMEFNTRLFRYLTVNTHFMSYTKVPSYDYHFLVSSSENIDVLATRFSIAQAGIMLRYAYGEKIFKNKNSVIPRKSNFPVVWFQYARGLDGFAGGRTPFDRFDLKISGSITSPLAGTTSLMLQAGMISKTVPYVMLFGANASFANFTLYTPLSFSTMRINEFTSDRFVSAYLSHNFGTLLYRSKYFSPEPELVTNIGFGWLSKPEMHKPLKLSSYSKGFYESGLVVNKLLDLRLINLGLAGFCRFGPYRLQQFRDNLALKIALQFVLN